MALNTRFSQRGTYPHGSGWLGIVNNVTSKRVACPPAGHHKLEEKHAWWRRRTCWQHNKGGFDCTLLHDQLSKQATQGKRQREPGQTERAAGRSLASGMLKATNAHAVYMNCILTTLSFPWEDFFNTAEDKTLGVFCLISKFSYVHHICVCSCTFQGECLALFSPDISNLPN